MDRLKVCFVVFLCVFIQFSANESVAQETDQEDRHVVPAINEYLNQTKVYTLHCEKTVDFFTAWRSCYDLGEELATIESSRDNKALASALESSDNLAYTSGTDAGKEGSYVWLVNKRPIPGQWNNFTAWNPGEPNNSESKEHCLVVKNLPNGSAGWNDVPCDVSLCYVCQRFEIPDGAEVY
ncbi:mannose-binding protein C-like [Culex pipiens pallens]|uniref:mannose-binding protein C-like n=1 Tax=Culex pipiens pallens TaxID=42434 RepID=UPI0022AB398C|nr:mannose-binding protein C-like [Culex pipiens pallens]